MSLAFSPDGKTLASSGFCVKLWDVATGTKNATLGDEIEGLDLSPDGKALAALSTGPSFSLWDVASGEETVIREKGSRRPRPRLLRYIWDAFPAIFEEYSYVPKALLFTSDGKITALGYDNRDDTTVKM